MLSELCYIDATGYHFPDYPTVLAAFQAEYRNIYGSDTYLDPDSQDGQWVAVLALAAFDTMALGAAVYNSFSPATAQGMGLSRMVKINGIRRRVATYSTATLTIVGQAGTVITNGQAQDAAFQKWNLPASVVIPSGGSIFVTATAEIVGAIQAGAVTITTIATPTRGWQTVTNAAAAVPGVPVETDAQLRARQALSVAIPSTSVMEGIIGAVADVADVTKYKGFENDTGSTDGNGLVAHSIAIVVQGGANADIADAIFRKKTAGTGTHPATGSTEDIIHEVVTDAYGNHTTINFLRPTVVEISATITISGITGAGYTSVIDDLIKAEVAAYINALEIGDDVYLNRLFVPANLPGTAEGLTFDIDGIVIGKDGGAETAANIVIAYNEMATCIVADITVDHPA